MDLDTWQEVFATLRSNALRTALTAWGVFWGAFMLVLMLGFGSGLETGVTRNILGFSSNSIYAWGQRTSLPYEGLPPGRRIHFNTRDHLALVAEVPELDAIAPGVELGSWRDGNNVAHGNKTGNFGVKGQYPEFALVQNVRTYAGRFLNERDMLERRKVAVIGDDVRSILFEDEQNPIGQYVKVQGVNFQVVGAFESEAPGEEGDRDDNTVFVPFTAFQSAFNTGDHVGWFGLRVRPGADPVEVEQRVRGVLAARHRTHPDDRRGIRSFNLGAEHARVGNLFRGVRFFVWFVCLATLMAGALGVSNIMLISVKERTREFGLRKALGATPSSIVRLVLQEACVLTALSGYLGIVVGVLALELVPRIMSSGESQTSPMAAPGIDLTAALATVVVLAISGMLAGLAPARHASRIHPVVALRSE